MGAIQVASLFGVLDLKDNLTPALGKAESGLKGFGSKVTDVGKGLTKFGAGLGVVTVPLTLIGKQSLNTAADFDSAMKEISARTGIVGADLDMVREFALQMGADTAFSAQQASEGFLQLLASGQDVTQALQTLPIVLDLAAASGEDLGFTADALTDIMAAFNLEIEDAGQVADVLARAAGASSADVASLAAGFANVGPIARQFGIDVETTAAALAVLAENGIKGSEAGTALKSMLMNMTRDTAEVAGAWEELGTSFYDAAGNARPLPEILASIQKGLEGKTAEDQNRLMQTLAGSYGVVGLTALLGSLSIDDMKESMEKQASAAEVAEARMDTFAGSTDALGGSIETLQIQAMTPFMNETLKPFIGKVTEVINKMAEWAAANPETTKTIILAAAGLIALSAAATVGGIALSFFGGGISLVTGALGLLLAPMVLLGLVLAGGILTNLNDFSANLDQMKTSIQDGDIIGFLEGMAGALLDIPEGVAMLTRDVAVLIGDLAGIDVPAGLQAFEGVWVNIQTIVAWLGDNTGALISAIDFVIPGPVQTLYDMLKSMAGWVGTIEGFKNPVEGSEAPQLGDTGTYLGPAYAGGYYTGLETTRLDLERDSGGSGQAGMPYLIGKGAQPELFMPSTAGTFYPRGSYPGGGGQTVIIQNMTVQDQDPQRWLDRLKDAARMRGDTISLAGAG